MQNQNEKIVVLNIIDSDDYNMSTLDTFYLVNPDENRLYELREMIEHRFEDDRAGKDNRFLGNFGAIYDYVSENFKTLDVKEFDIEW